MMKALLVLSVVLTLLLSGCLNRSAPPAQPDGQSATLGALATQRKIANAIAVTVNEVVPLLRDVESQEGDDVIHTSPDEPTARLRLAAVEARWKPVWEAEKALRLAQGVWASALEKGGDKDAAAKAVLATFCRFAPLLPRSVPRLSLATYLCEMQQ
jgi:hypothetical protein